MSGLGRARVEDLADIASIHCDAFPRSALSQLGIATVARYYAWLLTGPHEAVFLVHRSANVIDGFVVGGRFQRAFGGFVARNQLHLAIRLLFHPRLVLSRLGRRRASSVLTSFTTAAAPPKYRCLSIAVRPSAERRGVGRALLDGLTAVARAQGITRMQLGVDPRNQRAVRFYEQLGWTRMAQHTAWFGDTGQHAWSGLMEKHIDAPR